MVPKAVTIQPATNPNHTNSLRSELPTNMAPSMIKINPTTITKIEAMVQHVDLPQKLMLFIFLHDHLI